MSIGNGFEGSGYEFEDLCNSTPDTDTMLNEATEARRMGIKGKPNDTSAAALEALNNVFKAFNTLTAMNNQPNSSESTDGIADVKHRREQIEDKIVIKTDTNWKSNTETCDQSSGGGNNTEGSSSPVTEIPKSKSCEEVNTKKILRMIEQTYEPTNSIRTLDSDQIENMKKLKMVVSRYRSVTELLTSCYEFAVEEQGHLYPSTVAFLLITYFSEEPERYISMFALNPLAYYESPLTGTRSYEHDDLMKFLNHSNGPSPPSP